MIWKEDNHSEETLWLELMADAKRSNGCRRWLWCDGDGCAQDHTQWMPRTVADPAQSCTANGTTACLLTMSKVERIRVITLRNIPFAILMEECALLAGVLSPSESWFVRQIMYQSRTPLYRSTERENIEWTWISRAIIWCGVRHGMRGNWCRYYNKEVLMANSELRTG